MEGDRSFILSNKKKKEHLSIKYLRKKFLSFPKGG